MPPSLQKCTDQTDQTTPLGIRQHEVVIHNVSLQTEETTEPEVNGNGEAEEEKNGNGHVEEPEKEENGEPAEDESTLKRKDAPTEVEDSPKKQKLVDSEEKEAEVAPLVEA